MTGTLGRSLTTAEFYPITSVESSTNGDFYLVENLIQGAGSGFDSTEPHGARGTGSSFAWVTRAVVPDWYAVEPTPFLIFGLGSDQLLDEISSWGYADSNTNGAKEFTLRFATAPTEPAASATQSATPPPSKRHSLPNGATATSSPRL